MIVIVIAVKMETHLNLCQCIPVLVFMLHVYTYDSEGIMYREFYLCLCLTCASKVRHIESFLAYVPPSEITLWYRCFQG